MAEILRSERHTGIEIRSWTSPEWLLTEINSPWKTTSWTISLEPRLKWRYILMETSNSTAMSHFLNSWDCLWFTQNGRLFTQPLLHLSKSARLSPRYKHGRGEDVHDRPGIFVILLRNEIVIRSLTWSSKWFARPEISDVQLIPNVGKKMEVPRAGWVADIFRPVPHSSGILDSKKRTCYQLQHLLRGEVDHR